MEFTNVFTKVGMTLSNHAAYLALKAQYKAKGYNDKKARYAALGCMSGRSQGRTCRWYRDSSNQVVFERI